MEFITQFLSGRGRDNSPDKTEILKPALRDDLFKDGANPDVTTLPDQTSTLSKSLQSNSMTANVCEKFRTQRGRDSHAKGNDQDRDERLLLGDFGTPPDATLISIPGTEQTLGDPKMSRKPGGSFIPKNTLHGVKPNASKSNVRKQAGLHRSAVDNTTFEERDEPPKRRKMTHQQYRDISSDEEVKSVERTTLLNRQSVFHAEPRTRQENRSFYNGMASGCQESRVVNDMMSAGQRFGKISHDRKRALRIEVTTSCAPARQNRLSSQGGITYDQDMASLTKEKVTDRQRDTVTVANNTLDLLDGKLDEQLREARAPSRCQVLSPYYKLSHGAQSARCSSELPQQNIEASSFVHERVITERVNIEESSDELSIPAPSKNQKNQKHNYVESTHKGSPFHNPRREIEEIDETPEPENSTSLDIFTRYGSAERPADRSFSPPASCSTLGRQGTIVWTLKSFKDSTEPAFKAPLTLRHDPKSASFIAYHGSRQLSHEHSIPVNKIKRITRADPAEKCSLIRLSGASRIFFDLDFNSLREATTFVNMFGKTVIRYSKTRVEMEKLFTTFPVDRRRIHDGETSYKKAVDDGIENSTIESRVQSREAQRVGKKTVDDAKSSRPARKHGLLSEPPHKSERQSHQSEMESERWQWDWKRYDTRLSANRIDQGRHSARTTRSSQPSSFTQSSDHDDPVAKAIISRDTLEMPTWNEPVVYPPTGRKRTTVEFSDLERLSDDQFLNDNLIEFYIKWLQRERLVSRNQVYFFSTHFYTALTSSGKGSRSLNYDAVHRWTAKDDIFSHDFVIVPINENYHWYLAIICNLPKLQRNSNAEGNIEEAVECTKEEVKQNDETSPIILSRQRALGPVAVQTSRQASQEPSPGLTRPFATMNVGGVYHGTVDQLHQEAEVDLISACPDDPNEFIAFDKWLPQRSPSPNVSVHEVCDSQNTAGGVFNNARSPMAAKKSRRKSGPGARRHDPHAPIIAVLDSLGYTHSKTISNLKDYLIREGQEKLGLDIAKSAITAFHAKIGIPQQSNWSDCGLYLCGYADKFMQNPKAFGQKLLANEFVDTDWPDMNPSKMRINIRNILQRIYQEQAKTSEAEKLAKKAARKQAKSAARIASHGVSSSQEPKGGPNSSSATSRAASVDRETGITAGTSRATFNEQLLTAAEQMD